MRITLIVGLLFLAALVGGNKVPPPVSANSANMGARQCLVNIVNTYSRFKGTIIIIARVYADGEIQITPTPIPMHLIVTDDLEIPKNYEFHHAVALIVTSLPIPALLGKIPWNAKSKFVVIPRDQREVPLIFRDFWAERIVNVVIIVNHLETSKILTYFPHSEQKCSQVAQITEVGVCNDSYHNLTHLFPKKVSNMYGCPLKATVVVRPPFVIETPSLDIIGVEVEVIKIIANYLNATAVFEAFHRKSALTTNRKRGLNPLMQELAEKLSDVVIGSLMYTESVSSFSEAVQYSESLCVTFMVPKARFSAAYVIRMHFSRMASFLISTVFFEALLIPFVWFLLKRMKIASPWIKAVNTVVAPLIGSVVKSPRGFKLFYVSFFWMCYCLIFWKYWEADVSSQLIAPAALKELDTLDEVFNTDITIAGEAFQLSEVLRFLEPHDGKATISRKHRALAEAMKEMALYRNITFFGTFSSFLYALSLNPEYQKMVHIQKTCTTRYSPAIQTETDSPYLEEITKRVRALDEFGIIRKLYMHSVEETQKKFERLYADPEFSPMDLGRISSSFALLFIGLGCGLACFLTEILVFNVIQKFYRRQNQVETFH